MPPECDVSIRPGWFWHAEEDARVKTAAELMELYYKSVGRGGSMLLNVPPDRRGLLGDADLKSLREFGAMVTGTFAENLAAGAKMNSAFEYSLGREISFDVVRLRENISLGQRVYAFEVECKRGGAWVSVAKATSIGACRLLRLPERVQTNAVRLRITQAAAKPQVAEFGLFQAKAITS
jgi:alpha-L-fucosidase